MSVILFPSEPFSPRSVDPAFDAERTAARDAGFETLLVDSDELDQGNVADSVRRLPAAERPVEVVYRGWMLRAGTYRDLHDTLAGRGYRLINDPAQYEHAHHLPESYDVFRGVTPRTVWTTTGPRIDPDALSALLAPFGSAPVIVKDFVKSQKHHWDEACFIPSASDRDAVVRVASRFVELQGESLVGGLVFREFVPLARLAAHSVSGMPLTEEFRSFVLDGRVILADEYWDQGTYDGGIPDLSEFEQVIARVRSRFFTMDLARRTDGSLVVMEIGDAQVSGIPERMGAPRFYEALARRLGDAGRP